MKIDTCPHCKKKVAINRMSDDWGSWFYIHSVMGSPVYCQCRVFMESERFAADASTAEIRAIHSDLIKKWNRRA